MPRPFSEYSPREWLRLKPLIERHKHARYQWAVARRLRQPAAKADMAALRQAIAGRRVLVTVAFNDVEFIGWQAPLVKRHVAGAYHLIADNSPDDAAAVRIEALAEANGCGYLRLRPGPWRRLEDGGRSHGLAMSWVWRNLLRPGRPEAFGFIDHDIFPLRPTDPFAPLADHAVAGQVRNRSGRERWYLWAGFCFFRFDVVAGRALDFSLDWAAGLDTGGRNWFELYRYLAKDEVFDTGVAYEPVDPDVAVELARLEWISDWLHASNFSTPLSLPAAQREALRLRKRRILQERLSAALDGAPAA